MVTTCAQASLVKALTTRKDQTEAGGSLARARPRAHTGKAGCSMMTATPQPRRAQTKESVKCPRAVSATTSFHWRFVNPLTPQQTSADLQGQGPGRQVLRGGPKSAAEIIPSEAHWRDCLACREFERSTSWDTPASTLSTNNSKVARATCRRITEPTSH